MKRTNFTYLLTLILTLITLIIVIVTQSNNTVILNQYPELVVFGFLTAFALYFSVQIGDSELSMAHVVGMTAFLAYPSVVRHLILFVIFFGGLSGGFLMMLRSFLQQPSQRRVDADLYTVVYVTARVTISYFVATTVYMQASVASPLTDAISMNPFVDIVGTTILFAIVYTLAYTSIFALQLYVENFPVVRIFRDNWAVMSFILLAIVPFVMLVAVSPPVYDSIVSFAIVVGGTMFSVFGLHAISRVTQRVHKQLDEMRSLSHISQALIGHLNLQSLYDALYQQIQALMKINNFKIVLYDEEQKQITYDFVIQEGERLFIQYEHPDDHNLIQHVIMTGQSVHIQDNVLDEGLVALAELASWLGVPLLSGNRVIGVLVVSDYHENRHFSSLDEHLLTIIASTASVAIENTRLYEQKSERAEKLTTLNKVATFLSGTLLPDDVNDIIISSASTVTDANAVALYLPDVGAKNRPQFIRSAGFSEQFNNDPPQPQLVEQSSNIVTDMLQLKLFIIENIAHVEQDFPIISCLIAEKKRAWLELPIVLKDSHYGIIIIAYDEPQHFTVDEIGLMESFATHVAQAINNSQIYSITDKALEGRIEQLYALASMGRLLNATTDPQKICDVVLNFASDATQSERGFVILFNSPIDLLSVRDYDPVLITTDSMTQGLNAYVVNSRQAYRSDDICLETDCLTLVPHTRSLLIVPLLRGKECSGLIRLESNISHAFSDGDVHFVSQLANQALIAMDNTSLFQRIRMARDSLQTILDGMEDGILMINDEHKVTIANPPIRMLGLDPDEIIQQSIPDLLRRPDLNFAHRLGFDDERPLMTVLKHLNNSNHWHNQMTLEYLLSSPNGVPVFIKRLLIPVRDSDDQSATGIMMVFYNKTEEHQLAQARDALSQMIIHDLRSPLTAVTTSLTLLKSVTSDDDKLQRIINKTTSASQQAIQKVLSRINSLLDVSRMESGSIEINIEPSDLATIVDNVLIELSPLAHDMNISLQNQIPDTLPLLPLDSDKMERVLQNLVDNALKYSPRDSEIVLRASHYDKMDSSQIRIDIIDEGPGYS